MIIFLKPITLPQTEHSSKWCPAIVMHAQLCLSGDLKYKFINYKQITLKFCRYVFSLLNKYKMVQVQGLVEDVLI